MKQDQLFEIIPRHKFESLTKSELIEFNEAQARVIKQFEKEIARLHAEKELLKQQGDLPPKKWTMFL